MYGAVQAIGNLDIDIIDRYQAVKRKATKTIQKCNELLNGTGRGIDNGSEKSSESPWEIIPNKTPKRENTLSQESLISSPENKGKGPIAPRGGFGAWPDSGESGREREELLRTVKEITKGKGEIVPKQNLKSTMTYPKEESSYLEIGWNRLELPDNHYEFREKDLSWDYSDANIPYEGSYLTATSEMSRNVTTGTRKRPKGSRQRLKVSLHKPHMGIKLQ